METKDNVNNSKANFFKTKGILFLIVLLILILSAFAFLCLRPKNQSSQEHHSELKTTTNYSIEKVVCYSSAYGLNKEETQARWDLSLSQYTDIAIYLNSQPNISSIYIDNISYSNTKGNTYYLINLPIEDFGKTPTNNIEVTTSERIDFVNSSPITLRYLNQNFKENCIITDTENLLVFDGSLLKRGKVTLSSLKNTVLFTIHLIDTSGQEFTYPIQIPIPLENKETGETIYSGSYMEESFLTDTYFYVENQ